jgi:hypothetical protein
LVACLLRNKVALSLRCLIGGTFIVAPLYLPQAHVQFAFAGQWCHSSFVFCLRNTTYAVARIGADCACGSMVRPSFVRGFSAL